MGLNIDKTFIQSRMLNTAKGPAVHSLRTQADKFRYHEEMKIDALGGEMGLNIDKTFIQSRMLNTAKGPAVHSLRTQADKFRYHEEMKKTIENQENLDLIMDEVVEIAHDGQNVTGVITRMGAIYRAKATILATGVYLNSKIFIGEVSFNEGPNALGYAAYLTDSLKELGLRMRRFKTGTPCRVHRDSVDFSKMDRQDGDAKIVPAAYLTDSLKELGLRMRRFKTGTPCRVHRDSVDFSKMDRQDGDAKIVPFSFMNDKIEREQVPCYLTRTTAFKRTWT